MYIYERKPNKAKTTGLTVFIALIVITSLLFFQQQNQTSLVSKSEESTSSRMQLPHVDYVSKVVNPFNVDAQIQTHYFDVDKDASLLKNAIVEFEGVYRPSQGIDFGYNGDVFEVVAMLDGVVVDVFNDNLMGQSILIQSNDYLITYQSLSAQFVEVSDEVKKGMLIGYSGECLYNQNIGSHLHLVCEKDGNLIDPLSIIGTNIESE